MSKSNPDIERRLRLWTADCAARVLHIYEKTGDSPAPRAAIIASRQFVRGKIDAAAWAAASAAPLDASAAAWAATRAAEGKWQFDRLIARMSDDEPEDWPLPEMPTKIAAKSSSPLAGRNTDAAQDV